MNSVSTIKVLPNSVDINNQSRLFTNNNIVVKEQNTNRKGVYKNRTIKKKTKIIKIKLFTTEDVEEMVMLSIPKLNIIQEEPIDLTSSSGQDELEVPDFMDDILSKM